MTAEDANKFSFIFEEFPINQKQCAMYDKKLCKNSMIYNHVNEELPVILTCIINAVFERRNIIPKTRVEEQTNLKCIISKLSELKNALVTNKHMKPFEIDCYEYRNAFYETCQGINSNGWYNANWVLVDCYFYWIIHTIFKDSSYGLFDPFFEHKFKFESKLNDDLSYSCAVATLARIISNVENATSLSELKMIFKLMLKCSLWASRFEKELDKSKANNFLDILNDWSDNVVIDHSDDVWSLLVNYRDSNSTTCITLVTDNAGFELFCDMCLATFLLKANLTQRVCFHAKIIPWHKSVANWDLFFDDIAVSYKRTEVENLVKGWNECFRTGQFYSVREPFWSLPYTSFDMSDKFRSLYERLKKTTLVITKGNYNFYKLIGDRIVHPTSSMYDVLPLRGVNFLLIRLLKTDLITDVPANIFEHLRGQNQKWMQCEKYGIIQFYHLDSEQ